MIAPLNDPNLLISNVATAGIGAEILAMAVGGCQAIQVISDLNLLPFYLLQTASGDCDGFMNGSCDRNLFNL